MGFGLILGGFSIYLPIQMDCLGRSIGWLEACFARLLEAQGVIAGTLSSGPADIAMQLLEADGEL